MKRATYVKLWCAVMVVGVAVPLAAPTSAQDTPLEDRQALCPLVDAALLKLIVAEIKGKGECSTVCRGCGCKGGPGYRLGRSCVGWSELIAKCGPVPHAKCKRECTPVRAGCSGRSWIKALGVAAGIAVQFVAAEETEPEEAPDTSLKAIETKTGPTR